MVTIKNASDRALVHIAGYFRALADTNRLRILQALMERERNIGELVGLIGGSQANVSKHVSVLVDAGILVREPRGAFSFLRIADPEIYTLCDTVCKSVGRSLDRELSMRADLLGAFHTAKARAGGAGSEGQG